MKLREIFKMKDFKYRVPATARPDDSILTAVRKLIEYDRGSLAVCDDEGDLMGIITERDIIRKCFSRNCFDLNAIQVKDIMSAQVVVGRPDDDLEYAINTMREKRVRHLPIVDNRKKVLGMISMRDLLGVRLEESDIQVHSMSDYISGVYG